MGIRFRDDHLTCNACSAAHTPLNRPEIPDREVSVALLEHHPTWDVETPASEKCVGQAPKQDTQSCILQRRRQRLRGQEAAPERDAVSFFVRLVCSF